MKSRSTRVRTKVVALLVSLFALWTFAAFVTVREGLNLLWAAQLDAGVARPTEALVGNLQQERRLSLVYLGGRTSEQRAAMIAQRARTDEARNQLEESVRTPAAQWASDDAMHAQISDMFESLGKLSEGRDALDSGNLDRIAAAATFTEVIDAAFRIFSSVAVLDDPDIAKEARALVALSRSRELLSQEDALLAGVLAAGEFRGAEHEQFVQLVGAQRFAYAEAESELHPEVRALYQQLIEDPSIARFRQVENTVVQADLDAEPVPVTSREWQAAVEPVLTQLRDLEQTGGDVAVAHATDGAVWVIVRLALAGGLGLIAVIASIVISITTARALVRQLERLRNAAHELAAYRLPRVVDRLQHGEKVDVEQEAPPLDFGRDEIGQVGQAFNTVQETAVRVAVEQAELRRSVRDVFLSLARRSQALLHRQLGLLDAMERRATDAEELAELFRIDHLATRMRRNAENLIVLSGATAGRAWRKPVPMVDVLRGALAEVEDYTRVTVVPVGSASLLGRAVGDVIHLLAELIENAVSFSPPQTAVRVGGSVVGNGFAIEIEDRGLGMTPQEREAANEQLRNPPEFKLTSTARLGLYVVGKLAERHGIRVRLTESPYGGTTAIVLLPSTLIADESTDDMPRLDASAFEAPRARLPRPAGAGRHRIDAAVTADQAGTGHTGTEVELPLFNHVMQSGLAAAVPAGGPEQGSTGEPAPASNSGAEATAPGTVSGNVAANNGGSGNGAGLNQLGAAGVLPSRPRTIPAQPTQVPAPQAPATSSPTPPAGSAAPVPLASPPAAPAPLPSPPPRPDARTAPAPAGNAPKGPTAATDGERSSRAEPTALTPSGLPWRPRTSPSDSAPPTSSAPPAGSATPASQWAPAALGEPGTSPAQAGQPAAPRAARGLEESRNLMASYRSGTLRGRTEAARLADGNSHAPEWTPPTQESVGTEDGG